MLFRCTRMNDTLYSSPCGNANNLMGIDEIRVRKVIVGCQHSPVCTKTVRYPTECVTTHNYICAVTARADGLRLSMRAPHIQTQSESNKKHSKHRCYT